MQRCHGGAAASAAVPVKGNFKKEYERKCTMGAVVITVKRKGGWSPPPDIGGGGDVGIAEATTSATRYQAAVVLIPRR